MRVVAARVALVLIASACATAPSPSEAPEGPFGPETTCANEGVPYRVTLPETWFVHPQDADIRIGACTHFGPEPFDHDADALPGGRGSSVWLTYLNGGCLMFDLIMDVRRVEETSVAGVPAYRIVSTFPDGSRDYMYLVDLNPPHLAATGPDAADADCDQARGLTLGTREGVPGDFEMNRAIVDRMASTLQVGD